MRPALFAQWGLGLLLLLGGATIGCRRSSAAQPPPSRPPPEGGYPDKGGHPDRAIPPEPRIKDRESEEREVLLSKFRERLPLREPEKAEPSQYEAKAKLIETFATWLPEDLRKRIDVSQPICLSSKTACYVDVAYSDWKTFVEVNRAVLDAQPASPFMTFPGPRYRTGRVHTDRPNKKFYASWILALQLRPPKESHYQYPEGER